MAERYETEISGIVFKSKSDLNDDHDDYLVLESDCGIKLIYTEKGYVDSPENPFMGFWTFEGDPEPKTIIKDENVCPMEMALNRYLLTYT